jgi:hypothetical protein
MYYKMVSTPWAISYFPLIYFPVYIGTHWPLNQTARGSFIQEPVKGVQEQILLLVMQLFSTSAVYSGF